MKALSLTQPWASLVAIGAKRIETRSWATSYRGPIAIHAAKAFPRWARETCFEEPFYSVLHDAELIYPDSELGFGDERFLMPLGAIVAVARLRSCVRAEDVVWIGDRVTQEQAFGDYASGRWAWMLDDARPLRKPIPCKGALGLWAVPGDIARQLEALR